MTDIIPILQKDPLRFSSVVRFNPAVDKLLSLDLTVDNQELNTEIVDDTTLFSQYIKNKLTSASALYGIGGYAEHRTIYSRSDLFDGGPAQEQPRRLHLGTDIWGEAGTSIMAPLDGIVHSFAFNGRRGDYGATIILYHELDNIIFHTLYGHLSLDSIRHLQANGRIHQGEEFARFGLPPENGQWPPHLHFQLVVDMGNNKGDYPGVCRYREKEQWLVNSPDPDLVLQLNKYLD